MCARESETHLFDECVKLQGPFGMRSSSGLIGFVSVLPREEY